MKTGKVGFEKMVVLNKSIGNILSGVIYNTSLMSLNIKISNSNFHQRDGGAQLMRLVSNPIRFMANRHF